MPPCAAARKLTCTCCVPPDPAKVRDRAVTSVPSDVPDGIASGCASTVSAYASANVPLRLSASAVSTCR